MEITANALQTVAPNGVVVFNEIASYGNSSIIYRQGSGLVTLRGLTNQCRARFRVTFGANVGLSANGTVAPISLAIAINGEPLTTSTMISTPTAVEEFNNVGRVVFLDVVAGCCVQVSVENTGDAPIDV